MSSRPEVSVTHTRATVEHASDPALQRLSKLPLAVPVAGFLVLVVGGAVLGGILGAVLILVAAALVAWLAYLSWPRLRAPERLMRGAVVFLLVAVALVAGLSHHLLF